MTASSAPAPNRLQAVLKALQPLMGEQISTAPSVREEHSHGEAMNASRLPEAVLFAQSTQDVSTVLRHCHALRVPVVAFGAGTSVERHVVPPEHALSLDLSRMTGIVELEHNPI